MVNIYLLPIRLIPVCLIIILFTHISIVRGQSCSASVSGADNWSTLPWSCTGAAIPPTSPNTTFNGDIEILGLGTGEKLILDIPLTIDGNINITSTGADPSIELPVGINFTITGNLDNNNNNVIYIIDGVLQVDNTMEVKNSNQFSGSGTMQGGTLIVKNNNECGLGGCPSINFSTCIAGNNSFCDNNGVTLPIELSSFITHICENAICLDWVTSSETNNAYFEIERSKDMKTWQTLNQIKGAGNSSHQQKYTWLDSSPISGTNYYRLKQVDIDGQFSYSFVRAINFGELNAVQVYPNPNPQGIFYIQNIERNVSRVIEISNVYGQILMTKPDWQGESLNLQNYPPGIYYLKVQGQSHTTMLVTY